MLTRVEAVRWHEAVLYHADWVLCKWDWVKGIRVQLHLPDILLWIIKTPPAGIEDRRGYAVVEG